MKNISYLLLLQSILAFFFGNLLFCECFANAAILGGTVSRRIGNQPYETLNIDVLNPPPLFVEAQTMEGDVLFSFDEKQDLTLEEEILLWSGYVPQDFWEPKRPDISVAVGTKVSSHFIFIDPEGTSLAGSRWIGEITFNANVLGIIPTTRTAHGLDATHTLFAAENTSFGFLGFNGLDNTIDTVSFSSNQVSFDLWTADGMDPFRVITYGTSENSVPEPLTILGSSFALAFGIALRKASSSK